MLARRPSSSLSTEKKSFIAEGPSLGEFISGEVGPHENPYRRKKGQRYKQQYMLFFLALEDNFIAIGHNLFSLHLYGSLSLDRLSSSRNASPFQ